MFDSLGLRMDSELVLMQSFRETFLDLEGDGDGSAGDGVASHWPRAMLSGL